MVSLLFMMSWNNRQYQVFQSHFKKVVSSDIPLLTRTLEVRTAIFQVQQWLTDVSATGFTDGYDEAEKWTGVYHTNIGLIYPEVGSDAKSVIDKMNTSFEAYYSTGKLMANAYIQKGRDAGNRYMKDFDAESQRLGDNMKQLQLTTEARLKKEMDGLSGKITFTRRAQLVLTLVVVCLSGILATGVIWSITRPLNKMQAANQVAVGNMDQNWR